MRPTYTEPKRGGKIPIIQPEMYRFLRDLLQPAVLGHTASHADMIKNVVLEDLWRKIDALYNSQGM